VQASQPTPVLAFAAEAQLAQKQPQEREGMPEIGFATYTSPELHFTLTQNNSEQVTNGVSQKYCAASRSASTPEPRDRRLTSGVEQAVTGPYPQCSSPHRLHPVSRTTYPDRPGS
jgi:hypothetical protein